MVNELQSLLEEAQQVLGSDLLVLYQYEPLMRDVLVPPLICGSLKDGPFILALNRAAPPTGTTVWEILEQGEPFFASDARHDWFRGGFHHGSFIDRESIVSSAGLPLKANGETLGVLFVNYRTPFEFSSNERQVVINYAARAAELLRRSGLLTEEQRLTERLLRNGPLLIRSIILLGSKTTEGQIVEAIGLPWRQIVKEIKGNPDFLWQINWRELEAMVAGAYKIGGWDQVILTPRSGDRGRDIIASSASNLRVVDQVKAYKKERVVSADEVRSMLGVLMAESNVSKGIMTTTSVFAPGIHDEPTLQRFMPYRLELRNGLQLVSWLVQVSEM